MAVLHRKVLACPLLFLLEDLRAIPLYKIRQSSQSLKVADYPQAGALGESCHLCPENWDDS